MGAAHGLKLLHLVRRKDGGKLLVGLLEDGAGLLAALLGSEAGIGVKRGHLLLLVGQDGLKLCGLIGREIETLAKMRSCLLGIELAEVAMVALLFGGLLRGGIVRGRLLCGLLTEGN
jgi:hypothetical protein